MFNFDDNFVRLVDYIKDPQEQDGWESWYGVDDLIRHGVEKSFGPGTAQFLKEAEEKQKYVKNEILKRYGVPEGFSLW
jgi:hypothetical protein